MNLVDLDAETRVHMRAEVQRDLDAGTLYISDRLNVQGVSEWPDLLFDAVDSGDTATLMGQLSRRLKTQEPYVRSGVTRFRAVPHTAAETLAEGEFNRFYIRAICARAVAEGSAAVEVYRAKAVRNPRPESTARIGVLMDPQALLDDLRQNNHIDTALGVPAGPNSGLSVRLIPK